MTWPMVKLGEVLTHRKEFIQIDDFTSYKRCRVQLHAQGVVLRDHVPATEIKTKKQQTCRAGDFLVAEIDAKHGGYGIVPSELDGAIVSSHYFLFETVEARMDRGYLGWFIRTPAFFEQVAAQGSTNYAAIRPGHVLGYEIPLPPLPEQRRLVTRIDALAAKIEEAKRLHVKVVEASRSMLLSVYNSMVIGQCSRLMAEIAPLVRRPVSPEIAKSYPELGVRSFGRGTFHKPPLDGGDVGSKKLFEIHPGDVVFNNVFAWEGAVAVAQPNDIGRVGSHRFITCVPKAGLATPEYINFHFSTKGGLAQLGEASPGGAGRNRTLGLESLSRITVPFPSINRQHWFGVLIEMCRIREAERATANEKLDALLPAILDRAFRDEL